MNDKSKTPTAESTPLRLLADSMLGRLSRWLRLMGYDTAYATTQPDHRIAAQARAEGRIILTRDQAFARRKGISTLLIDSQVLETQIQEVVTALGPPEPGSEPRCPQCNAPLLQATEHQIQASVPSHILQRHRHFRRCVSCDKVYWRGSHWQNVQKLVEKVLDRQGHNESQPATTK